MQRIYLKDTPAPLALQQVVDVLRSGGLVIFPTETTYGAGVDALNPAAVQKLLKYKARREGKPLSIAVLNKEMAAKYVEINESALRLYERFLPGPVTVISKSLGVVAPGVESEFGTLGIRIPNYAFILQLLEKYQRPITATSANISDGKRPYTVEDILDGLPDKQLRLIDLILDAGELPHNPPSTVIDTTLSTPVVFRQGEVEIITPTSVTTLVSNSEAETKSIAGRMLLKHWSELKKTGVMIGLNGSLGTGKTIFAKGIAEFLQIENAITSPTYTYIEEYDFMRHGVQGRLQHLDIWKVESGEEMDRLEFRKLLNRNTVIIIEWAQKTAAYLKAIHEETGIPYIEVNFSEPTGSSSTTRQLEIKE